MVDGDRVRHWSARILAPVAFFAAVTLLVLVVQNSLEDDGKAKGPPAATTTAADTGAAETGVKVKKRIYRVAVGDTLESIAERFDTTVPDLLTLNPKIDPLALAPGQRIRVQ